MKIDDFDFVQKLNKEINKVPLEMSDRLKNEPINTIEPKDKKIIKISFKKKFWMSIASTVAAASIGAICIVTAIHSGNPTTPIVSDGYVMTMNINPSISVLFDNNGNVKKVMSENDDGDLLLQDSEFVLSMSSKKIEDVAVELSTRAAKMGFIDFTADGTDNIYNNIEFNFSSGKVLDLDMIENVRKTVTNSFMNSGIYVFVETKNNIVEDIKTVWENRYSAADLYFDRKTKEEQDEMTITETVYNIVEDIILGCVEKYDLYIKIDEVNEQIKELVNPIISISKKDYWDIKDPDFEKTEDVILLVDKMSKLLDKLYFNYGDECRNSSLMYGINSNKVFKHKLIIDAIKKDINENTFKDKLSHYTNLIMPMAIDYGYTNELLNIISSIFDGITGSIIDKVNDVKVAILDWSESLLEKFTKLFEAERDPITTDEYNDFFNKIKILKKI